jgi:hypothetical protein
MTQIINKPNISLSYYQVIEVFFAAKPRFRKLLEDQKIIITAADYGFFMPCPNCLTKQKLFYNYRYSKFTCLNKPACNLSIPYSLSGLAKLEKKYRTLFTRKKKETLAKIKQQLLIINQTKKNLERARSKVNHNLYLSQYELSKVLSNKLPNVVNTLTNDKPVTPENEVKHFEVEQKAEPENVNTSFASPTKLKKPAENIPPISPTHENYLRYVENHFHRRASSNHDDYNTVNIKKHARK